MNLLSLTQVASLFLCNLFCICQLGTLNAEHHQHHHNCTLCPPGTTGPAGPTGAGSGSGTPNILAKWITPTTLGDSNVSDDGSVINIALANAYVFVGPENTDAPIILGGLNQTGDIVIGVSEGGQDVLVGQGNTGGSIFLGPYDGSTGGSKDVLINNHLLTNQITGTVTGATGIGNPDGSITLTTASDLAGQVSITTDGDPVSGKQAIITFERSYITPPMVYLFPANDAAASVLASGAYVTTTINDFTINYLSTTPIGTTQIWNYLVIGPNQSDS